jgi:molybdopterin molybdotransferase
MLSVDEALEQVLGATPTRSAARVPACEALGLVLAEDVASDVDSPPHDKSIVDGYAIMAADLDAGPAEFAVLEEVTAGNVPQVKVARGGAVRIMTGAPLPEGADAVVMVEQSEPIGDRASGERVRLSPSKVTRGQNIMRRAVAMARGDLVIRAGHTLRAIELGLLAEVGRSEVLAIPRPRLAVLATGNELVAAGEKPAAGQIRNSNSPMLVAAAREAGAEASDLGIARDEQADLKRRISDGLEADVLVLSGGVSAGVLDLVPAVLEELGVQAIFHKVRMKPGKPLWFGVKRHADERTTLVFGLPGNPASSFVGFELFVRPAIATLAGRRHRPAEYLAQLASAFTHRGDRPTFQPAVLTEQGGIRRITPLHSQGSGDLRVWAEANALACFPEGDYSLAASDEVRVRPLG